MLLTKLQVATHQLNVAVQLFLNGDYLSSLTLAGAAEEILGQLSRNAGKPAAIDFLVDHHKKDTDSALTPKQSGDVIKSVANRGRNQVKHANDPNETHFDAEQVWPLQMIMRAIPMANALGGSIANEPAMRAWVDANPDAIK